MESGNTPLSKRDRAALEEEAVHLREWAAG
jgi:hypothetical protein